MDTKTYMKISIFFCFKKLKKKEKLSKKNPFFFFFLFQFTKQTANNKAAKPTTITIMSSIGKEKKKRKRRESSKNEEKNRPDSNNNNIEPKKRRGRPAAKSGVNKKKIQDMSDEERKKYQKSNREKQRKRRNVKQLGLGQDQCYYIKQLFSSLQMKAEESDKPRHRVTNDTITALDNLRECALYKILAQANNIQQGAKNGNTFGSRVAVNAIRLSVPISLFDQIAETGMKALKSYKSGKNKDKEYTDQDDDADENEEEDKSTRGGINVFSGLTLSVTRVIKEMRARCTFNQYSPDAAIFVTAALQVILEKIILLTLLSVSRQKESAKAVTGGGIRYTGIDLRDVRCAVENDGFDTCGKPEDVKTLFTGTGLTTFFSNATWSQVGTRRKEIAV